MRTACLARFLCFDRVVDRLTEFIVRHTFSLGVSSIGAHVVLAGGSCLRKGGEDWLLAALSGLYEAAGLACSGGRHACTALGKFEVK